MQGENSSVFFFYHSVQMSKVLNSGSSSVMQKRLFMAGRIQILSKNQKKAVIFFKKGLK